MTEQKQKYYIPYHYDAVFYKIFGDYNDLDLIKYLLENVLNINIKKIEILNGKVLGDKIKTKKSFLDLLIRVNEKMVINIEVNTDTSQIIKERNIGFLLKVASNDFKSGEKYRKFKKHIQYNLNIENNTDYSIERYFFKELKKDKILSKRIEICNINLSYYSEKCYNEGIENLTEFEKLMGLLGAKDIEHEKIFAMEKGMLKKIMDKGEKFRNDSEIIDMYEHDLTYDEIREYEIEEAVIETTEKVTEEVTNKVTEEVTSSTTRNIAIKMLEKGMDIENISDITSVSIDELKELKKELD